MHSNWIMMHSNHTYSFATPLDMIDMASLSFFAFSKRTENVHLSLFHMNTKKKTLSTEELLI